jgi:hypothetical protein
VVLVPYVPRRPESAHTPVPGRTVKGARRNRRSRPCTTKAGTPVARRGSGCRSRCSRCAASSTQGSHLAGRRYLRAVPAGIWPTAASLASIPCQSCPTPPSYHYHTLVRRRHGTGRGIDRFCNVPAAGAQERARGALNAKPPYVLALAAGALWGFLSPGLMDGWMIGAFGSVPVPASRFRSRLALHFHLPPTAFVHVLARGTALAARALHLQREVDRRS